MNNKPKPQNAAAPVFRARNPNQHHHQHVHQPRPHASPNIPRPRPPSFSRAPWDVTQWVDPIETQYLSHHK
ncbi:unnamed protein product [Rotaria socialis]|uniref:Uncharacterized protein n=1 Tax=Rotaria socialis TaxID=392032 RepID=A0A820E115_9BILA|nr:unnamed protein product [Rotaria socialis]CAF3232975.1 unnamed protein product [Rotaria socialis]CAF3479381.1 unnamed protein product [Rotaria socialis]CAF3567829.1 unnamed protein product [Rotaria socialis]CAF4239564.1 unnamed protein product [Rotaria socialis]